jgi:hypothetical protein
MALDDMESFLRKQKADKESEKHNRDLADAKQQSEAKDKAALKGKLPNIFAELTKAIEEAVWAYNPSNPEKSLVIRKDNPNHLKVQHRKTELSIQFELTSNDILLTQIHYNTAVPLQIHHEHGTPQILLGSQPMSTVEMKKIAFYFLSPLIK